MEIVATDEKNVRRAIRTGIDDTLRRLHRERGRLINERSQHINRIKGLCAVHGIYDYEPTHPKRMLQVERLRTATVDFDTMQSLNSALGHWWPNRVRQIYRSSPRHRPHKPFLHARNLWPMYPLSRRRRLGLACAVAHG
jgi:hypothetical protein